MPKQPLIEIPLCGLAVIGPFTVILARLFVKQTVTGKDGVVREGPKGIGSNMIQLISLLLILPLIAILALEGSVSLEITGTLIGSIVGFTLGI